jgi:hypothetical protein
VLPNQFFIRELLAGQRVYYAPLVHCPSESAFEFNSSECRFAQVASVSNIFPMADGLHNLLPCGNAEFDASRLTPRNPITTDRKSARPFNDLLLLQRVDILKLGKADLFMATELALLMRLVIGILPEPFTRLHFQRTPLAQRSDCVRP